MEAPCPCFGSVYGNPDESDRLLRRAAAWSRNPCDRNSDIGAKFFADTQRHLQRNLFAHSAVSFDVFGADIQRFSLDVIMIGYHSAQKDITRAWNTRNSLSQQSTSTTLGDGKLQPERATFFENDGGEIRLVLTVDIRRHTTPQFLDRFSDQLLGARLRQSFRGDAQIDTGDTRQIGKGQRTRFRSRLDENMEPEQFHDCRQRDPSSEKSVRDYCALRAASEHFDPG